MPSRESFTVLFVEVSDSVRLYSAAGDTNAAEAIARCMKTVREEVEENGGRVIKLIGDGLIALFPTANDAAAAAASMQAAAEELPALAEQKVAIRVAFHAGPVIERDGDVFGDTVNVASRLVEQTLKGQVLTTARTVSLLAPALRAATRRLYEVTIKGKAEEVELCELVWRASPDITDLTATHVSLAAGRTRLQLKYRDRMVARRADGAGLSIGRDAACGLVVADPKASRQHCVIERRQGKFVLRDQSSNGTFVTVEGEAEIVLRREEMLLRGRGWIAFGQPRADTTDVLEYRCEEEA